MTRFLGETLKPRIFKRGGWWRVDPMYLSSRSRLLSLWHAANDFCDRLNTGLGYPEVDGYKQRITK